MTTTAQMERRVAGVKLAIDLSKKLTSDLDRDLSNALTLLHIGGDPTAMHAMLMLKGPSEFTINAMALLWRKMIDSKAQEPTPEDKLWVALIIAGYGNDPDGDTIDPLGNQKRMVEQFRAITGHDPDLPFPIANSEQQDMGAFAEFAEKLGIRRKVKGA